MARCGKNVPLPAKTVHLGGQNVALQVEVSSCPARTSPCCPETCRLLRRGRRLCTAPAARLASARTGSDRIGSGCHNRPSVGKLKGGKQGQGINIDLAAEGPTGQLRRRVRVTLSGSRRRRFGNQEAIQCARPFWPPRSLLLSP